MAECQTQSEAVEVANTDSELEHDFIEEPDQDCFCPVNLELLTQPHQTTCCGNHISQQAADKLITEGQPCPMCKEVTFNIQVDKYFKRNTINKLKIRCPYKKSGCEWTGELGDLDQHTTSCTKSPWSCPYCPFQSLYEASTDHAPQCDYQPIPCPNHCEVDTVPCCHVEKHLATCPLQLVDCEFASAGCNVRVPRKDLAGHMTESAQQHLMTATLLNLRLTKDLYQKMEEKDKQISELKDELTKHEHKLKSNLESKFKTQREVAWPQLTQKIQHQIKSITTDLKQAVNNSEGRLRQHMNSKTREVDGKVQQQAKDIKAKIEQQAKSFDTKLQQQTGEFDTKLKENTEHLSSEVAAVQQEAEGVKAKIDQQAKDFDRKIQQQTGLLNIKLGEQTKHLGTEQKTLENNVIKRLQFVRHSIGSLIGFTNHGLVLTDFTKHQAQSLSGRWFSNPFYNYPGGYKFQLNINTNGSDEGYRTHLCAYVGLLPGDHDTELRWPITVTARLEMTNQQGDYTHYSTPENQYIFKMRAKMGKDFRIIKTKYYPLAELRQSDDVDIQYLYNDSIKFVLKLKIE